MLIDWLSLRLPINSVFSSVAGALKPNMTQVRAVGVDGEILWTKYPPERLRSDTHQVVAALTDDYFYLSGSPCRVDGENNVFGVFDLQGNALSMINYARKQMGVYLPDLEHWDCTRIDCTQNLYLSSSNQVSEALEILASTQGGHYRVSSRKSTVYYNRSSDLLSGKAYAKGPHLEHQVSKKQAVATVEQMEAAQHLLRLELTFGSRWIRRWRTKHHHTFHRLNKIDKRDIWALTETELQDTFDTYWARIVGQATEDKAMTDDQLLSKLNRICETPGRARSAYQCWLSIRGAGVERTKDTMARSTWHKHKAALFSAGLTWADFSQRKVVALRARTITARPVNTWAELHELRKAA